MTAAILREAGFRWKYRHPSLRFARWWTWLFFEDGQGWFRWAFSTRDTCGGYLEPPEPYTVAPPLRRVCMTFRFHARWPLDMRDDDRKRHAAW